MNENQEDFEAWQSSIGSKSTRETHARYLLPVVVAFTTENRILRVADSRELQAVIDDGIPNPGPRAYTAEALRAFFRWLIDVGLAAEGPDLVAPRPRGTRKPVLGEDEVRAVLEELKRASRDDEFDMRQRQMLARASLELELAYACGIAPRLLVTLKDEDVTANPARVSLELEPGRRRTVPVTDAAIEAIEYWKSIGRHQSKPASWLLHGRNKQHLQMPGNKVAMDLKRVAALIGRPSSQMNMRAFRRAFASHMLQRGFNDEMLAFVLGMNDLFAFQRGFLDE